MDPFILVFFCFFFEGMGASFFYCLCEGIPVDVGDALFVCFVFQQWFLVEERGCVMVATLVAAANRLPWPSFRQRNLVVLVVCAAMLLLLR